MELTRKLEEGFHTLGHDQWTGQPDEEKLYKYHWFVDVKVDNGRITAIRNMGQREWAEADLPALAFEEVDQ